MATIATEDVPVLASLDIMTQGKMPFVLHLPRQSVVSVVDIRGWFVEQKLMLSSIFWCGQIYKSEKYDFGHNLLWHLSQTSMFNKTASEVGL